MLLFLSTVSAQAIDNTPAFRNINSDHYFRINYENDFFTGTDHDYTQGVYFEWVHPSIRHFPLTALLLRTKSSALRYGLALESEGYTPNYIEKPAIQYGDRPYAGVLLLKTFLTSVNAQRRDRLSAQISAGIIGRAAGGEAIQKSIHRWINFTKPLGWNNQIRNDIILNYQVNYEKELLRWKNHFSFSAYSSARLGTLSDKASAGVTVMLGNFHSAFSYGSNEPIRKFQFYVYDTPLVSAVAYDATLQGGLFHRSSPYTIPSGDVNRITFVNRWGVVMIFKRLYFEYYQSGPTQDYVTGAFHKSGGLQVGFGF
ncbi:MAG: lipid A deacylase LpxR family protein [Flavitalea sp.]